MKTGKRFKRFCFCCEKPIQSAGAKSGDKLSSTDPASEATFWTSCGNYGSTVFDSFGERTLEILICDDCLKKKANLAIHFGEIRRSERFDEETFDQTLSQEDDGGSEENKALVAVARHSMRERKKRQSGGLIEGKESP